MKKNTDKRQNRILEIIVESYVDKAEPIGSRFVSKKMGLSSATVRNIMADLEEDGYIFHPHTSAGRIPTDKGYRYYVDKLMDVQDLVFDEEPSGKGMHKNKINNLEDAITSCSKTLSSITNYVSVILYPRLIKSRLRRIELIFLERRKVLVIAINSAGVIKESIVELGEDINIAELSKISKFLNEELMGLELTEIENYIKRKMYTEKGSFYYIFKRAMEIVDLSDFLKDERLFFHDGTSSMLSCPEFRDPEIIRHLLNAFEEKDKLAKVLSEGLDFDGITIHIGKENYLEDLKDFTIAISSYKLKDYNVGALGVIGPRRMSYPKVVSALKYVSNQLTEILSGF